MSDNTNEKEKKLMETMKIIDSDLNFPVNDLITPSWNPNQMDKKEEDKLEQSMLEYGFVERIIVNKYNYHVVGGNHRLKIAKERLGLNHVPVDFIFEKDLNKEKLLNIALNKISGKFDKSKIKNLFSQLAPLDPVQLNPIEPIQVKTMKPIETKPIDPIKLDSSKSNDLKSINITSSGYSLNEIEKILDIGESSGVKEDGFNDFDLPSKVKPGEVWKLGNHTLMCGDSTKLEDYQTLISYSNEPDMIFTDPPYGIDYKGGRTQVVENKNYGKIANDDLTGSDLGKLLKNVFHDGIDIYICCSPILMKPFLDEIESFNRKIEAVIVWDKTNAGLGYMKYRRQCEFIIFLKGSSYDKDDISDTDMWRISRGNTHEYKHGNQKPIRVPARAIRNSSEVGDTILDLFGGSGSTLIACEQMKRKCSIMELDPHFCDVIIRRWENFTGETVKLIDDSPAY